MDENTGFTIPVKYIRQQVLSHLPNNVKMASRKTFLFLFLFFLSFFASVMKNFLNKNKPKILLLGSFYSDLFIFLFCINHCRCQCILIKYTLF